MTVFQMLRLALKGEPIALHDLVYCLLILAVVHCNESVCVGELGEGSDCLCSVSLTVGACYPLTLYSQG